MSGLRIAMIGTRGVPAAYGGFETAVEEIGSRLVQRGHKVLVYSRNTTGQQSPRWYKGMRSVTVPALNGKTTETLSHTGLSVAHTIAYARPDVAFVFNAANAPVLPALRAARIPVATHVDGLEWQRTKWGPTGRRYYLWAERSAVRWSDALIADAQGIADYYRDKFGAITELLTYGAPLILQSTSELLPDGALPKQYHLVVARFEPENHVLEIVSGYAASQARLPLLVVGAAPFAADYTQRIEEAAAGDPRVRFLGRVDDQPALDQLYANALTYLHGHSVGGTNPSLLRAMGAAAAVVAFDVSFNREVAGRHASYFSGPTDLAAILERIEQRPEDSISNGRAMRDRAQQRYNWDEVTAGYEELAERLAGRLD